MLKIAVSGASGLIGSALCRSLQSRGHHVYRLVRKPSSTMEQIFWDPVAGQLDAARLEGLDAVVHLAGENVAARRWTAAVKQKIRDSRRVPTDFLCRTLASLAARPRVLVCASAIGFYGSRGDEELTEESPAGTGFLAEACQEWEQVCQPARDAGIRVVSLRTGIVLSSQGGALAQMKTPFKCGLGGVLGSGRQWWSWIALDDELGAIEHAILTPTLSGPLNLVAPQPVTNAEFTQTLAKVLHRPALLPAPAWGLRLAMGEMADEMLLASARVLPQRLQESGYGFRWTDLEAALRHELN